MDRVDAHGRRVTKYDTTHRCDVCVKSTDPGWLQIAPGEWISCPQCNEDGRNRNNGKVPCNVQVIEPTRRIFLPSHHGA